LIFSPDSVPGKPVQAGCFEAGFSGFADGLTAALMFVIWGHVADAGVQPDRVVVAPGDGRFGPQWASLRSVETSPMRRGDGRNETEVR
jgi:hypothetical protein